LAQKSFDNPVGGKMNATGKLKQILLMAALLLITMMFCNQNAYAEQMKKLGKYNVHYIALGSTFITPDIAKAYNIERSRFKGLINISVLDSSIKGNPAHAVAISGTAKNLIGTITELNFREIREGEAIYYIASIDYRNEEKFNFDIKIDDGQQAHTLTFKHKFYVD
jgi:hypothetical protein